MSKTKKSNPSRRGKSKRKKRTILGMPPLLVIPLVLTGLVFSVYTAGAGYFTEKANSCILNHRLDDASGWLDKLASFPGQEVECAFLRARVARKRGDYATMDEQLQLVRELTANMSSSQIQRNVERTKLEQVLMAAQTGDHDYAENFLEPYLISDDLGPYDKREVCESFIFGYIQFQLYDPALLLIDTWIKDFPNDARPYYLRASISRSRFQPREAEKSLHRALELNPQYFKAAYELASVMMELKETEKALQYLKIAIKDEILEVDCLIAQSHAYRALGDNEKARELLRQALAKEPGHYSGQNALGQLLVESQQWKEAIQLLEPVCAVDKNNTDARYFLAQALRAEKRFEEASEHFEAVEEIKNKLSDANEIIQKIGSGAESIPERLEVAKLFMDYGSEQESMIWLHSALQLDEDNVETLRLYEDFYTKKYETDGDLSFKEQADNFRRRRLQGTQ